MTEAPSPASLAEAPTFRPTAEEWAGGPLKYMFEVVRPQAERIAGLARIIPPSGWQPPLAIDPAGFRFPTRPQSVHLLHQAEASAASRDFWDDYGAFQRAHGARPKSNPTFAGQEVDLYSLSRLVTNRGGYKAVTDDRGWREVASSLQASPMPACQLGAGPCLQPAQPPPRAPLLRWERRAAT